MCGRYYRRSDKQRIAEAFKLGNLPDDFVLPQDFNVAPSTFQPVIRANRETGDRELEVMRWGLLPYFAKSPADFKGFSTINTKAETVATAPTWRRPFERRRCLIPADGFYEWKNVGFKKKQPYTHLVTADDIRVAGELGALLDKEFLAQDLPKFPPNAETATESYSEAV